MSRITQKFKEIKKEKRIAFMPFLVAGDPNFKTSLKLALKLAETAELLEIGFPYSDPLADGPVIQAADLRALKTGANTTTVFRLIKEIRKHSEVPITVLVYANLVYQRGINNFYKDAKASGVDGVLIPDLPLEESEDYQRAAKKHGIDHICMVTQTTSSARLKEINKVAQGFLYLVSVLGVTGQRKNLSDKTLSLIKRTKVHSKLPIAVGFGISTKEHARAVFKAGADGFIVGSALIKIIESGKEESDKLRLVEKYVRTLSS